MAKWQHTLSELAIQYKAQEPLKLILANLRRHCELVARSMRRHAVSTHK